MARHRRCLASHQSILAPERASVLRAMRAEQEIADTAGNEVEERDLTDYDRITEVA